MRQLSKLLDHGVRFRLIIIAGLLSVIACRFFHLLIVALFIRSAFNIDFLVCLVLSILDEYRSTTIQSDEIVEQMLAN